MDHTLESSNVKERHNYSMQKRRPLINILETYCSLGLYIFPVNGENKRPIFKDPLNKASCDIEQVKKWAKEFPHCGWALSLAKSKLFAVDIDLKHGGLDHWKELIESHGEIETWIQRSGSGGLHYLFKHDGKLKLKGKIRRGIDVKFNGYIILYPTIHKSGDLYTWISFKSVKVAMPPKWIVSRVEKRKKESVKSATNFGASYLKKIVNELRNCELDYEQWVNAGMAIHSSLPTDEGFDLFLHLTHGASYKAGDEEQALSKWESFSNDNEEGITDRTLIYLLKEFKVPIPSPSFETDFRSFTEAQQERIGLEAEKEKGWFYEGNRTVTVHPDFLVSQFHKKGYAFLNGGGNAPILSLRVGSKGEKQLKTMTLSAFQLDTAPLFFKYYKVVSHNLRAVYIPASKVWLESRTRKTFDNIVFVPEDKAKETDLNLWGDIPCKRVAGDVSGFLSFVKECLCGGNEVLFEWFMDWLAHLFQKPWEKATLVPVLIGDQGTGKGLLVDGFLRNMLGPYYNRIMTAQTLKERFNVEQSKKFLTFIDEATWRGDKVEDGILKSLTGSDTMAVEEKFGGRYTIENYSRYIIASNNPEAVAIERSNRRYVVIECSKLYAGNTAYFEPLWGGIRNGNLVGQVFNYLMNRNIEHFNPFLIPKNNFTGKVAKVASEGIVAQFWEELFFENPKELWFQGEKLAKEATYREFIYFANNVKTYEKNLSRQYFWRKTKELIPSCSWERRDAKSHARCVGMTVEGMVKQFCDTLKINPPDDLELLDYFLDEEFETIP